MKLNQQELKHLQSICLEMIEEIDRICRKNDIEYSLDSGTLLGAVRHQGFIPWDDDADISMSRAEYEKFFESCKTDLNKDKFFLQEFRTDKDYSWGYSKLRMNGTKLIAIGQEHLKCHSGIFIDIFIYDNVPDSRILRVLHTAACFGIRKCQYAIVGQYHAKNAFLRFIYKALNKIPKKWVFSFFDWINKQTNRKKRKLMSHKTFPYSRKECHYGLPSTCFDEYTDIKFNNKTFRCVKDYDTYLSLLYGDYMTPPPENKRKGYPIAELVFPR